MGNAVRIRRMTRSDYPQLVELIRRTWYADAPGDQEVGHDMQCRNIAWRLAAIDAQDCLSRATYAAVAERDGHVIGMILGSNPKRTTRMQLLRHRLRQLQLGLPMLASRVGRNGLCEQLALLCTDRMLARDAGKDYPAEIALFLVAPEARGLGVGGQLFDRMLDRFRVSGIREYFLFTDTSCNYGFYEYKGLRRVASRSLPSEHGEALECFLYEGNVDS